MVMVSVSLLGVQGEAKGCAFLKFMDRAAAVSAQYPSCGGL